MLCWKDSRYVIGIYYVEISIEITDGGNLVKVIEEYYSFGTENLALKFLNSLKTACSEKIVGMLLKYYVEIWIEITDRSNLLKINEKCYSFGTGNWGGSTAFYDSWQIEKKSKGRCKGNIWR